jgi:uncharacterized protein (DUF2141 family)
MTFVPPVRANHRLSAALAVVLVAPPLAPAMAQNPLPVTPSPEATCQGEPSATRLHVKVDGVRSDQGVITLTLYGDNPDRFLRHAGELKVWRADATAPVTEMCVFLPAPGAYAAAVYHDNKRVYRFTQGAFGMPTQDYGFSRNPHLFLGPPSLDACKFNAAEGDTTVLIKLKYP